MSIFHIHAIFQSFIFMLFSYLLVIHTFRSLTYVFAYYFDSFFLYLSFTETGMNEDGSFIGQYGKKGKPPPSNNQAFATLV